MQFLRWSPKAAFCNNKIFIRALVFSVLVIIHSQANSTPDANMLDNQVVNEEWLSVIINQQPAGVALFLNPKKNILLARKKDLNLWRIRIPKTDPFTYQGEAYYRLDLLPRLIYQIDNATQTVTLSIEPALFEASIIGHQLAGVQATPPPVGGFMNYDFFGGRTTEETNTGGVFEFASFNPYGLGTSDFLIQRNG